MLDTTCPTGSPPTLHVLAADDHLTLPGSGATGPEPDHQRAPAPPPEAPLSHHLRHRYPYMTDDGRSLLSLVITAEATPALEAFVVHLRHLHLGEGQPDARAARDERRARTLTRRRLHARPQALGLAPGHEDRALRLSLPDGDPLHAHLPAGALVRAGTYLYGLSRAAELLAWAQQHGIPAGPAAEVEHCRARPGGHLQVRLGVNHVVAVSWSGGIDPDRLAAARTLPGYVKRGRLERCAPAGVTAALQLARMHHLRVTLYACDGPPISWPPPVDEDAVLHAAQQAVTRQDTTGK